MDEDCPLAAAIRSGERDDLMWAIFRKMAQVTEREQNGGYSTRYHETVYSLPARTHCPNGHEYTSDNTGTWADGARMCRTCERSRRRRRSLRRAS